MSVLHTAPPHVGLVCQDEGGGHFIYRERHLPSSWLPMAVTMVAISAGSQTMSLRMLQAMTAPDWE